MFRIIAGRDYLYTGDLPKGCRGQRYHVHGFVLDVPSYQEKVLVEALTGRDRGLWFTCSPANFAQRYELAPGQEPVVEPVPAPVFEKVVDFTSKGKF